MHYVRGQITSKYFSGERQLTSKAYKVKNMEREEEDTILSFRVALKAECYQK
jgi:hypothetical protein